MPLTETEPKLAEVEYALRRDRASTWYDQHDVGFEELESSDDGQKAVGIRVFNIAGDFYYAPIFFNGGKTMGDELLYSKSDDMFIPFVEEWTQFILRNRSEEVGQATEEEYVPTEPDLGPLVETPQGMQGGRSAGTIKPASRIVKQAADIARNGIDVDLEGALRKAGSREKAAFMVAINQFPKAAEYVFNTIPDLMEILQDQTEKSAESESPTAENKRTLETKVVERADRNYINPTSTGLYMMITRSGKEKPMLVMSHAEPTHSVPSYDDEVGQKVLVVDTDDGVYDRKSAGALCARTDDETDLTWSGWHDGLSDARPTKDNAYVFVGPEPGQMTGVVDVKERVRRPNGHVVMNVFYDIGDEPVDQAIITKSEGRHTIADGALMIPATYKAVKVDDRHGGLVPLATPDDVLLREGEPMHVKRSSSHYIFEHKGDRYSARGEENAIELMKDEFGLNEKRASAVLHDHDEIGRDMFLIKKAQPLPPMQPPAPQAGPPAGPPAAGPAPGPGPAEPGPAGQGGSPAPPMAPEARQAMEAALQADQEGQKGPIETAILSNMLHVSDDAEFVRGELGNILKAVDSWGRILWRIYSDYEEFEEDLGGQELTDLIDSIKNLFTSGGENVIRLKEKLSGPEDLRIGLG